MKTNQPTGTQSDADPLSTVPGTDPDTLNPGQDLTGTPTTKTGIVVKESDVGGEI